MKVILQHDIPNLGEAGDIITVKNGYARNFLLPRNLVMAATASNEKQRRHQERISKLKKEKKDREAADLAKKVSELQCEFKVRVGDIGKLYGSITSLDIAENLRSQGLSLDKRKVQLAEPIKALGEYEIKVKLAKGIETSVKLKVMDLDGNLVAQIKEKKEDELDNVDTSKEEAESAEVEATAEGTEPVAEQASTEVTEPEKEENQ